jgi:hypothetical protein
MLCVFGGDESVNRSKTVKNSIFLSETGRNVKNVELLFGGGVYSHEVASISGMFWYRVLLR